MPNIFTENSLKSLLLHLLLMILITILAVLGVFQCSLPALTDHGNTVSVPDVKGMDFEAAQKALTDGQLKVMLADSTYEPNVEPFTVLDQTPAPNDKAKLGRTVYLTVQQSQPPPRRFNIYNVLYKELPTAVRFLQTSGFSVSDSIEEIPSTEKIVLQLEVDGHVYPDTARQEDVDAPQTAEEERIYQFQQKQEPVFIEKPEGTVVRLVVGDGSLGEDKVPTLAYSVTYGEAVATYGDKFVFEIVDTMFDDVQPDSMIVEQDPTPRAGFVKRGTVISVTIAIGGAGQDSTQAAPADPAEPDGSAPEDDF